MSGARTDSSQFMAFLENPADIEVLREALKGVNIQNSEIITGGVKEAIETFSHQRSPQYLVIDISKSELAASDLNRLSEVCEPGVSVLAVGVKNDVGLYRDLMKLGIFEYVVSPLFPEILGRALKNMVLGEGKDKEPHSKVGKIITVVGSRGGVGNTFIATNFAAMLATEKSRRVVIVDLDPYFGTVSLYFDLKPNFGLVSALEDPERLDQVFLERLLSPVNERLFVLGAEEPLDEPLKYKVNGMESLLKFLSKLFHYVVIDMPHYPNDTMRLVMDKTQIMLLVTDSSLAGLRDAGRLMRYFGEDGLEKRLILVMNKHEKDNKNNLTPQEFEGTLKHKINHYIPYDPWIPREYINRGKTLVEIDNALADGLRGIVDDVQGKKKGEEKSNVLKSFFQKITFK